MSDLSLRIVMVSSNITDDIDTGLELADGPTVILQGSMEAVRAAASMFGEQVAIIRALIDNPGKEAALCEIARPGQEFDAAIFSDVESLYENGEPGKKVMPSEDQKPNIRGSDTAPAGLSAGGGAGWQPIETAPRDGSRFLGFWPSSGRDGDFAITTWWDAFDGLWESPFESADYDADYGPTGWMPHPPATEGGA